jgi:hypothetical protein
VSKAEGDLLEAFIARLADWASPDQCEALKRELRAAYAGQSYYIRKSPDGYRIKADRDSTKCKLK